MSFLFSNVSWFNEHKTAYYAWSGVEWTWYLVPENHKNFRRLPRHKKDAIRIPSCIPGWQMDDFTSEAADLLRKASKEGVAHNGVITSKLAVLVYEERRRRVAEEKEIARRLINE